MTSGIGLASNAGNQGKVCDGEAAVWQRCAWDETFKIVILNKCCVVKGRGDDEECGKNIIIYEMLSRLKNMMKCEALYSSVGVLVDRKSRHSILIQQIQHKMKKKMWQLIYETICSKV